MKKIWQAHWISLLISFAAAAASEESTWTSIVCYEIPYAEYESNIEKADQKELAQENTRKPLPAIPLELFLKKAPIKQDLVNQASLFSFSLCPRDLLPFERELIENVPFQAPNLYEQNRYAAVCMVALKNYFFKTVRLNTELLEDLYQETKQILEQYGKLVHAYCRLKKEKIAITEKIAELKTQATEQSPLSLSIATLQKNLIENKRKLLGTKRDLEYLEQQQDIQLPNPFAFSFLNEALVVRYTLEDTQEKPSTPFIQALIDVGLITELQLTPLFNPAP